MAELLAASTAIGVASSLITFADVAWRVLKRLDEYSDRTKDVPKVIRNIRPQLQLLVKKLEELKRAESDGSLATNSGRQLSDAMKMYEEQITILDKLTQRMLPAEGDSKRVRAIKALSSIYYEVELSRTWAQIESYKTTFILYFTNIYSHPAISSGAPPTVLEVKPANKHYHYPASVSSRRLVTRETPLRQIEAAFLDDTAAATSPVVVLLGMGGCGKTQLALQYCQQCELEGRFSSIFWVDASSLSSTAQSFATIVGTIEDKQTARQDPGANIEIVKHRLATWTERWLVVFDNFDDPKALNIRDYFPHGRNGAILFTSRHGDSKRLGHVIALAEMSQAEGLELLFRQAGCERDESNLAAGKDIIKRLGSLALAIDQAGAYISTRNLPLNLFLDHYNKRREKFLKETPGILWEYRRRLNNEEVDTSLSVFTTWEMSFEQIDDDKTNGETLKHLLNLSAFFDNKDIFEDLFKIYFELEEPVWMKPFTSEGAWDSYEFQDAVAKLAKLSLISRFDITASGTYFSFHPLVQDWIKLRLDDGDRRIKTAEAISVLANYISSQGVYSEFRLSFNMRQILLSHLDACSQNEPSFLNHTEEIESMTLLWAACYFADVYRNEFQLAKAEFLFDKVLKGYEKVCGPDNPDTLDAVNKLALVYIKQNRLAEAEVLYDRALPGYTKSFGPDNPKTLDAVHNLAIVYCQQNRLAEAEALYDRALSGYTKSFGPDNPDTLDAVHSLATVYYQQNRLAEAEALYDRALLGFTKSFGPDNPKTLDAVHNLATVYNKQDRLAKAEALYDRALLGFTKSFGPDNPETLNAVQNLATVYIKQDRLAEAEALSDRALSGYTKSFGPDNPETLDAVQNLAIVYNKQDRLAEAEALYDRALSGYTKSFGPDNPKTLDAVHNLAIVYNKQDRLAEAEALYDRALSGYTKSFGPDNPNTLDAVYNLAIVYDKWRYQAIQNLLDQIIRIRFTLFSTWR